MRNNAFVRPKRPTRPTRPTRPSELAVLEIDGTCFDDLCGFARTFSEHLSHEWHGNLDALNDILRGGFGTPEDGFVLRWTNADRSRTSLGSELFETIIEIIRIHGPGGDEGDDGVILELA